MANQDFAHIARTTIRTIGAIQTDFKLEVPFTGTIPEVTVTVGGFSSFTGPWNLDFKLNGTLMGIDISIDGTDTTLIATGLSEAVTERDLIEPFITSLGGGGGSITGPIIITYTFKPAEKTTPVDADTVGLTDSAASSAPKRVTWANIKATLLAYFDTLYVALTGAQTIAGVKTFSSDPIIPDEVYGAGWNGSLEPPTKNAVYDKVESLSGVTDGDKGDITVSGGGATWTADADAVVKMAGAQTVAGVKTFSSDPLIPDEAYDATNWNGVLEPPTKNAVRDKIEDILDGVTFTGDIIVPDEAYDATNWDGSLEVPTKNAVRDKIEAIVAGAGDVATDTIFDAKGDIPVGTGADAANNLPVGTDGQVLTADSGETMGVKWEDSSGGGMTWTEVAGTSQAAAVNNGYITNDAALVTVTLPTTAAVGSIVAVQGLGAGGWKIAQNASEQIKWTAGGVDGVNETTAGTGGFLASTDQYDQVELICLVADTTWGVRTSKGTIQII